MKNVDSMGIELRRCTVFFRESSEVIVRCGFVLLLIVNFAGCYDYSSSRARTTAGNVRALSTHSPVDEKLVEVNVVGIAAVSASEGARMPGQLLTTINEQILHTFESELTMEVRSLLDDKLDLTNPEGIRLSLRNAGRAGVDALLVTLVDKYQERRGSRVGAEEGAEVAFRMRLLDVTTGNEVWQAQYHFRDHPLSDNIFDLKEAGTGWERASQLIAGAFRAAARDIADRRNKLFLIRSH